MKLWNEHRSVFSPSPGFLGEHTLTATLLECVVRMCVCVPILFQASGACGQKSRLAVLFIALSEKVQVCFSTSLISDTPRERIANRLQSLRDKCEPD